MLRIMRIRECLLHKNKENDISLEIALTNPYSLKKGKKQLSIKY